MSRGCPVLQRLILTFKPEELIVHALYRRKDGPGPNTKIRRQEVAALARSGLERALAAIEKEPVVDLGTSGFEIKEDVLGLPLASSISEKPMRKGA
jgi:hypothetical protein